ncbi:MAG: glycosyltransferase [Myxococcales bacterium]|nr:glycosyltransferase [Myxococcales bacterium]
MEGRIHIPQGVGLVIVGRNEGPRLLKSLERTDAAGPVVYVDSGSRDGSPDVARNLGFHVLELDPAEPFTAARGRNEGFAYLARTWPGLEYVHFQDGDCLVHAGWLEAGRAELARDPKVGLVSGVLREQHADASVFNRLLDMEWQQPAGDDVRIGGNAMVRAAAFEAVGGFKKDLPAGEEGDLHLRLRQAGWIVRRIDVPMAFHDADMRHFSQWWQRCVRSGQATAEGVDLHAGDDAAGARRLRSNFFWGLAVPAVGVLGAPLTLGMSTLVPAVGFGALYTKILRAELARGRPLADAELYARFMVLAKVPQAVGQLRYRLRRARGEKTRVIDWRDAGR